MFSHSLPRLLRIGLAVVALVTTWETIKHCGYLLDFSFTSQPQTFSAIAPRYPIESKTKIIRAGAGALVTNNLPICVFDTLPSRTGEPLCPAPGGKTPCMLEVHSYIGILHIKVYIHMFEIYVLVCYVGCILDRKSSALV